MYDEPAASTSDLEAIMLVHKSIAAEAEAEYCDVLPTTQVNKKAKEAAAAAVAMRHSIQMKQIDTFGMMEAVARDPIVVRQLYTFAAYGSKAGLHGMISPHLYNYPQLNRLFSWRVRAQKITQQQVEREFKDYRYGVAKGANDVDDLKEFVHIDRENRLRRKASYQAVGATLPSRYTSSNSHMRGVIQMCEQQFRNSEIRTTIQIYQQGFRYKSNNSDIRAATQIHEQ